MSTTAQILTYLETDDGLVTVLHAYGPGSGIDRPYLRLQAAPSIIDLYGVREAAHEFPTAVDAADLATQAQAWLDEASNAAKLQQIDVEIANPTRTYTVGALVRIADGNLGINTTARIRRVIEGEQRVNLQVGNPPTTLAELVAREKEREREKKALGLPAPEIRAATSTPGFLVYIGGMEGSRAAGVEVHAYSTSGYTPTVQTRKAAGDARRFHITDVTAGAVYYIRARLYDEDGAKGPLSREVAVQAGVIEAVVADGSIDITKIASGLRPVRMGDVLPTLPHPDWLIGDHFVITAAAHPDYLKLQRAIDTTADGTADTFELAIRMPEIEGLLTSEQLEDLAVSASKLAAGAVDKTKLATSIRAPESLPAPLPTLPNASYPPESLVVLQSDGKLYRNVANVWTAAIPAVDISGQITSGQIADSAITAAKLGAAAVTTAKLANDAVTTAIIAAGAITASEIAAGAVGTAAFAAGLTPIEILGALPSTGLFAGRTVLLTTDNKIYRYTGTAWTAAVPTTDLTGTIGSAQIADSAITAAKLGAAAVTTAKLANDAVTSAIIAAGAITATEIAAGAVGTAAFAAGLTPIEILGALPSTGLFVGRTVMLTTDNKIYRYTGTAWTAAVPTTDLTGTITTTQIAVDAITSSLIAANAITTTEISDGAISTPKIATGAITAGTIAAGAITTAKIAAGAVTATEIAAGTITAAQIAAGTITTAEIAADTITAGNIAAGAITASEIATGAITTIKLAAGAVTATEIASGAITTVKLAAGAVTAATIAAGTITTSQIAADTITAGNIATGAITASEIAAGAVTAGKIAASAVTATEIAANTITAAQIAAGTITTTEIAADTITAGNIAAGAITASEIAAGAITAAKIAAGTITATEIASGAITTAKIAAGAVTAATIAAGTITTTQIAANTITAGNIATGAIAADEIASGAITTVKIAAGAVTAATIATGTITATQIATGTITATQLAADTITAAKIAAGAITASEIAAGAITAKHLTLTDYTNLVPDYDFVDFTAGAWEETTSVQTIATDTALFINRRLSWPVPAASNAVRAKPFAPVTPGEVYRFSTYVKAVSTPNGALRIGLYFTNATGGSAVHYYVDVSNTYALSGSGTINRTISGDLEATGWRLVTAQCTVPAGKLRAQFRYLVLGNAAPVGSWQMAMPSFTRAASASLIVDGAITATQIAAGAITAAKIATGTITATQIASGTITATQIAAGTITATQLAADTITAAKIAAGAITTSELASDAVTAVKIAASTITSREIGNVGTYTVVDSSGVRFNNASGVEQVKLGNISGRTGVPSGTTYGLYGTLGTSVIVRGATSIIRADTAFAAAAYSITTTALHQRVLRQANHTGLSIPIKAGWVVRYGMVSFNGTRPRVYTNTALTSEAWQSDVDIEVDYVEGTVGLANGQNGTSVIASADTTLTGVYNNVALMIGNNCGQPRYINISLKIAYVVLVTY